MSLVTMYRPQFYPQLNPHDPLGGYSCTAYSASYALDRATLGGVVVPGYIVREHTGLTPNEIVLQKGLTLVDARTALNTWNVQLHLHSGEPFANAVLALASKEGVLMQGLNATLGEYGCSSFVGPHCVYLNQMHSSGDYVLVYNPLCQQSKWVPIAIMEAYCKSLGNTYWATTRSTPLVEG
jgi:hypothetical protein